MSSVRVPEPPASEPGHHPETEQDKPVDRRPRPRSVAPRKTTADERDGSSAGARRFGYRFDGVVGRAARAFVLRTELAYVEITDDTFVARFGPWTVNTPLANVASTSSTGPYRWWKVAGPPRLSFADRGLTFATNTRRGACITFHDPVAGVEPTGLLRHPGLTVTVDDVDGLLHELARRRS